MSACTDKQRKGSSHRLCPNVNLIAVTKGAYLSFLQKASTSATSDICPKMRDIQGIRMYKVKGEAFGERIHSSTNRPSLVLGV